MSELIMYVVFRRRVCNCSEAGSLNNNPECLPDTGICQCKEYVLGHNCDRSALSLVSFTFDSYYMYRDEFVLNLQYTVSYKHCVVCG